MNKVATMLKPIRHINCSPALIACQGLMQTFSLWLCKPEIKSADLTKASLSLPMPGLSLSVIEADWLWDFLQKKVKTITLLENAQTLANLDDVLKHNLETWLQGSASVAQHFSLPRKPLSWPIQRPFADDNEGKKQWKAFQTLMESFYEKGLRQGLPYRPDGVPTTVDNEGVTYKTFRAEFRQAHRQDLHPDSREVCVLCGGELSNTSVDHWIAKASYPLLSVCADNLVPICGECNQRPNKGDKDVYANGSFEDWFHPYKRHPNGSLKLDYDNATLAVTLGCADPADQKRVKHLNDLLNLESRWTRELKAEYRKLQKAVMVSRYKTNKPLDTKQLYQWLEDWRDGLIDSEPHYEVHQILAKALLDPVRATAWREELLS